MYCPIITCVLCKSYKFIVSSYSRICAHLNEKEDARAYYNKVSLIYMMMILWFASIVYISYHHSQKDVLFLQLLGTAKLLKISTIYLQKTLFEVL